MFHLRMWYSRRRIPEIELKMARGWGEHSTQYPLLPPSSIIAAGCLAGNNSYILIIMQILNVDLNTVVLELHWILY